MLAKVAIKDLGKILKNQRVMIRVDFNVPIKNGKITDDTRIRESIQTIRYAQENGAKAIALMSHLGRPNGEKNPKFTLQPIAPALSKIIGQKVEFLKDCVGDDVRNKINRASNGQIFLLENLRYYAAEEGSKEVKGKKQKEKKEVIDKFRKELTMNGDIYINDAFGTSHRAHSSITGIKVPIRAAGFLLQKEIEFFAKVLENPQRPLTVILGGAKVQDKIQLIKNMIERVDKLIITGGMAFTFLKSMGGVEIGKSIFDAQGAKKVPEIMEKAREKNVEIIFPEDFRVAREFKDGAQAFDADIESGIPKDCLGLDCGPKTVEKFGKIISESKTIFLNGSNGVFEFKSFRWGSAKLVESLVAATKSGATTVCGGGDTIALVNMVPGANKIINHMSTGGGASIELMEGKTLPGLTYLTNKSELKLH